MKTNLYVLYGGKSAEHEVSLLTAFTVLNTLDKEKYNVYPIYITEEGIWCSLGLLDHELLDVDELRGSRTGVSPAASMGELLCKLFSGEGSRVVLPVLHGTNGEDGTVQGMLELMDVPYTGNGVLTSAAGMDKVIMKELFARAGIPQADYLALLHYEWNQEAGRQCQRIEETIGYPCYVKPANLGSSIGISRCENEQELYRAIELAFQYDRKLVIEKEVVGREVQLAVIGNDRPVCSVAGEFLKNREFFDYNKKYKSGQLIQQIPAHLSEEVHDRLRELSIQAFTALDGAGLMRADFFVTDEDEIYINEVNTLPGFTKISMFPALWAKTDGTTYGQLIDKLIELALERHAHKQNRSYRGNEQ
ncbi:D-alanine--D-alanine ligase [Paenibacillus sp. J2TS4]|uniref:D-alanine--D-alanine ligase n=1 Tax=Paenibacillus sp. J2TS4 TaxID=2807194 RepID=UPI001B0466A9|nr:D-alanine--D-alanine ligase [Paenibacillus sp. J2TS4]GIP33301.1 D-alanine--D-alanine ligase [Paenibacillus sp. J2TS4]